MTDDPHDVRPGTDPSSRELAELAALLADRSVWAEPSPEVEDRLFGQIARERAQRPGATGELTREPVATPPVPAPPPGTARSDADVVPLTGTRGNRSHVRRAPSDSRGSRWRRVGVSLAAAAVVGMASVGVQEVRHRQLLPDRSVVLAGGDFAPGSSAVARIDHRDNGLRIVLEVTGLPPAPEGTFYAGWLVPADPRKRVPIGTFHLREGKAGIIELWSGVELENYPVVSVTLQEEGDPSGPGTPVLRGRVNG